MTNNEVGVLTPESVRCAYMSEYRRFLQMKAGTKPVSQDYIDKKCNRLSDEDATGANFWQKLQAYCLSHNLEPLRLAKAFFSVSANLANYTLLNHNGIFNREVLSAYERLKPGIDFCKDKLVAQKKQLTNQMDRQWFVSGTEHEISARNAMQVTTSNYCALFRYCTLHMIKEDPGPWLIPALRQYLPDKEAYDAAWGDYIPEDLKVKASLRRASA